MVVVVVIWFRYSVLFLALLVGWFDSAVGWMSEWMDGEC